MAEDLVNVLARAKDPPDPEELEAAGTIVIDWREEDSAIVDYVAAVLPSGMLTYDADQDTDDLILMFDARTEQAGLTISPIDRSVTICALNRLLRGRYEIRALSAYVGTGDTILISVQSDESWDRAERRYPEKVRHAYVKFVEGYDIFGVNSPEELASAAPRPWDAALAEHRQAQAATKKMFDDWKASGRPIATPAKRKDNPVLMVVLAAIGVVIAILYNALHGGK